MVTTLQAYLPNLGKFTVMQFVTPNLRLTPEAAREMSLAQAILRKGTEAILADTVVVVPAGAISSTDVQGALQELDADKQPLDDTLTALAGTTTAADQVIYATGPDAFSVTPLTAFARSVLDDPDAPTARATLGAGTVSSVSVAPANGFAGTVANPSSTPTITLTTPLTGLLKGNGTAMSAAVPGTDYVAPGGALGTPSSGTLTNATGLPIATGVAGLAAGAAAYLGSSAGFEQMLANVSLAAAGTSLPSGTITAKKNLRIRVRLPGYAGSDTASFQFNGAAGTAYRYRWWFLPAGSVTPTAGLVAASTDRIKIASANTTNSRVVECIIENDPNVTEKLVAFTKSVFGTGSAGTQATDDSGNGAWISGAATQITSVNLISSSNMNIGTEMTIWGWD